MTRRYSNGDGHWCRMASSQHQPSVETLCESAFNQKPTHLIDEGSRGRENESANALEMRQELHKTNKEDENRNIGKQRHQHLLQ